ncbi:hypothetical protein OKA04_13500 [Luteolibacter flavescens]|uniref:Uncharacterized protein n=1 Tax=Luteolibacter flavescens TaxID=1859460 RepID=A0ABT3FQ94_9BACT|nr:hypothetical protein [Luteolibacter flavescens]MCW1885750.1 hypothetical protein [Luteolibacter flavescens]
MNIEPPPLPPRLEPPPLPERKKRRRPYGLLLLPLAALVALYVGPLRVEVDFTDDAGRVPAPFEVTLRTVGFEKKVLTENGRVNVLRGLWREIEVTDDYYIRSNHPVRGGSMRLVAERNTILKLRHAATGQPSVPQRGDPDPRQDRER